MLVMVVIGMVVLEILACMEVLVTGKVEKV